MSIDLSDLVDNLKREVNPPGTTIFADATDTDYEGYLADSFWEMVLRGYITGFTADDTVVSPTDGSTDSDDQLGRALQQLVVINSAMTIMRIHLANIDTGFRAHAGAAEFETRKSAAAITAALEALSDRFNEILVNLPSDNEAHPTYYTDISSRRGFLGGYEESPRWVGY